MIAVARHVTDEPLGELRPADVLPAVDGVDVAAASANVRSLGGDPRRFGLRLGSALEAVGADADTDLVRGAIALAAWRSGVLALRDAALATLASGGVPVTVAAAALAIAGDTLDEFTERQRNDRFWWPGRAEWNGYVRAVGGFAGLGGAWIEPPSDGGAYDDGGAEFFLVRTGEGWWRIDADVWGARLTRARPPVSAQRASRVTVVTRPDSYLAWLHVRDA
ncbi:potassium transporter Kef [Microbacterium sp. P04]|uniref:potassium transporter Kef n=1 Tax=Microbacterium sp. P04 TaxID=3366947 RepID=UPI0037454D53